MGGGLVYKTGLVDEIDHSVAACTNLASMHAISNPCKWALAFGNGKYRAEIISGKAFSNAG